MVLLADCSGIGFSTLSKVCLNVIVPQGISISESGTMAYVCFWFDIFRKGRWRKTTMSLIYYTYTK